MRWLAQRAASTLHDAIRYGHYDCTRIARPTIQRNAIVGRDARRHSFLSRVAHSRVRLSSERARFASSVLPPSDAAEQQQPEMGSGKANPHAASGKQQMMLDLQQMLNLNPSLVDADKSKDLVFVCIDCEAFEFSPKDITEIGVSILDTRATQHLPAVFDDAGAWHAQIQHLHYRTLEHGHLLNKKYVKGCPTSFHHGPTTWIRRADALRVLDRIFQSPSKASQAADFAVPIPATDDEQRSIILVGHNISSDVDHLKHLGFALDRVPNVVGRMDTQALVSSKKATVGLQRLLLSLDFEPKDLHNAGNDAAYTLQALLRMAVRESVSTGSVAASLALLRDRKLAPAELTGVRAEEVWAGTAVRPTMD